MTAASNSQVAELARQVSTHYGGVAAFNVFQYNVSLYSVPATQQGATVRFDNCQDKPATPPGLYGPGGQFNDIPIPSGATPAAGTDSTLTIWQPSSDTMWELWKAQHSSAGWSACWGGRMNDVSSNPGFFSGGFGAGAAGLADAGGAVSIADIESGHIDHAVALAVPDPQVGHVWPAQRDDGTSLSTAHLQEGSRLRLSANVDLGTLGLTPIAMMIAKAAQTYGFIVTDRSGAVAVPAESGHPSQQATGVNPWSDLLHGTPSYEVLKHFPWAQLQVVAAPRPGS